MTNLKRINLFLQIFFFRIAKVVDTESKKVKKLVVIFPVVPFTGWSTDFKWVGKQRRAKLSYFVSTIFIILLVSVLRLYNLGGKPLWIDEVLFYTWVTDNIYQQEFIPLFISKFLSNIVDIHSEFWLRLPFALTGILCVGSVFLVKGINKYSLLLATLFAIFPPFVFWSQMARPYIFGSLFIILGYRWWGFYILGLLTTPLSIVGLNLFKIKKNYLIYIGLIVFAWMLLQIRPDMDRGFNLEFLYYAKRIWVLPFTIIFLYLDDAYKFVISKWK